MGHSFKNFQKHLKTIWMCMSHTSQSGAYSLDHWPQSHGDVLKRLHQRLLVKKFYKLNISHETIYVGEDYGQL